MKSSLFEYRKRPIPDLSEARELRRGSREHPIDFSHPLCSERLIDIGTYDILGSNYYHMDGGNPPYNERVRHSIPHLLLRESVVRRLFVINERLRRFGIELFVYDAYRPIEVQDFMFLEWMPNDVRVRNPLWPDDRVRREVCKFWGRGSDENGRIDPSSPPFHSTGGAVDLTLRDRKSGLLLPMGSGFDDFHETERAFTDYLERTKRVKPFTFDEDFALGNRRILYWALIEEGFVNNPNEVWHFGLYDQLWAALLQRYAAFYSLAFVPFLIEKA